MKQDFICRSANLGTCINLLMVAPSAYSPSYFFDHQHFSYHQAITMLLLYKSFTSLPVGGDFSPLSSSCCFLYAFATALASACFHLQLAVGISTSPTRLSGPPKQDLCLCYFCLFQQNLTIHLA